MPRKSKVAKVQAATWGLGVMAGVAVFWRVDGQRKGTFINKID
jgi:hypothetical protein